MSIDEALVEGLTELSADRADVLTHAVRALEPRRPLEPLGILCGPRAMEHAMLGVALYRLRPPGTGLTMQAIRRGATVWVSSLDESPPIPRRGLLARYGVQAGGAVPVMDGSRVAAVIEVLSFTPMERSRAIEELLERVAASVGREARSQMPGDAPGRLVARSRAWELEHELAATALARADGDIAPTSAREAAGDE